MPTLQTPASSSPGERPGESQGRLINVYAAPEGDSAIVRPAAGSIPFSPLDVGPRGGLSIDNTLFVAVAGKLYRVASDGTSALVGTLAGTGPVTMARNNKSPPDRVVVTDTGAFTFTTSAVSAYPDPDVGSPNSVTTLDNYLIFTYGDGTIRASDLGSTSIATTSNAKAESNPDGLLRGIVKDRQFIALGQNSTEFWYDAATTPFPLARAEVVSVGLFGRWAVAGFQDGWDRPWFSVSSDRRVLRWDGYTPIRVSTPAVERAIAAVEDPETLLMLVYVAMGNAIVSISGPGFTWDYFAESGLWFERASYGLNRWRCSHSVYAFGEWMVGDTQSADLLMIDPSARTERDQPLVCSAEGLAPAHSRLGGLRLAFSTGQGQAGSDDITIREPRASIDWSIDGGASYGNAVERSLGRQGEYRRQVAVRNLGASRDRPMLVRWTISDPVPFAYLGGVVEAVARR